MYSLRFRPSYSAWSSISRSSPSWTYAVAGISRPAFFVAVFAVIVCAFYQHPGSTRNRPPALGATLAPVIADLIELAGEVGEALDATVTVSASVPHDLRSAPAVLVTTLEFAADAAIGATSISLRLPAAATGLTGQVPKGLVLTIPGETAKTVAADARAEGDVIVLTLTTGLAAAHLAGVDVTLAPFATFACPNAIEQAVGFGSGMVEMANGELIIPMAGAPALFRLRPDLVLTITSPVDDIPRRVRVVAEPQRLAGGAWAVYYSGAS